MRGPRRRLALAVASLETAEVATIEEAAGRLEGRGGRQAWPRLPGGIHGAPILARVKVYTGEWGGDGAGWRKARGAAADGRGTHTPCKNKV